ncbi:MAG: DUF882 domain-containing protein [Caulobacterales bacterium]
MTLKRRELLRNAFALAGAAPFAAAGRALAFPERDVRRLGFNALHTGETLDVAYWENGSYLPDALAAVNHVLRDHRDNSVHVIEPKLLDLLTVLQGRLGAASRYEVICGYRSPQTNAILHAQSSQVASGSLHMTGQAIDIRLPGAELTTLRDTAETLGLGGVGYYSVSQFVHVDVGRVRRWSGT